MVTLPLKQKELLINMPASFELKSKPKQIKLTNLWIMLMEEFLEISLKVMKVLIRFPTTYLWEKTFLLYAATKTKHKNRLNAETDPILPQFEYFVYAKRINYTRVIK